MATCKHRHWTEWRTGTSPTTVNPGVVRRKCNLCGELLSLGPSNDGPLEVRIEMRAAFLGEAHVSEFTDVEWLGHENDEHYVDSDDPGAGIQQYDVTDWRWQAGYLASFLFEAYT